MLTRRSTEILAEILREAARREILPRFRRLGKDAIRQKTSATDLVTDADEAAERHIAAALGKAFPGCVVIGEEGVSADRRLLDRLADADLAFVVDPVDGTLNFASGLPLFAVMAAAIVRGEVAAAVIHDPMVDDSSVALRGEGAWLAGADGRTSDLRVAAAAPTAQMSGMISWRYMPEPLRSSLPARFPRFSDATTLRCCGQEYRLAAAGHCHFLLYGRLMPWDHAPGSLLHREAGGYSALLDGSAYRPTDRPSGLLCAPDRASWEELREVLAGA